MTLATSPLHPDFGVEISGVDLKTLNDTTFEKILNAYHEHGAVLFRD